MEPYDEQMEFDIEVDTHEPVTRDKVLSAVDLIGDDYEMLCKLLEPTEDERKIIKDVLEDLV